jgi:hypothetical protein
MNRFGELEGNFSSQNQPARLAVGEARITETGELLLQSGVFHEGINAQEVRMVEDVDGGGVEIDADPLRKLDSLKYGDVADVGDRVLGNVARGIAERRAEDGLRGPRVDDVVDLVCVYSLLRRRGRAGRSLVQGIQAEQRRGIGCAGGACAEKIASVRRENAHRAVRRLQAAQERTGGIDAAVEGAEEGGIIEVACGACLRGE